ncbi:hypothetical protein [Pontibacter pamirensis]|uniref:hypothetical protein n=1 Tax=Pontibacter pamirensis TaxID=2562824 RepID=UPI001389B121|nr:hypothetical protein [Pontibacter pamirensis]
MDHNSFNPRNPKITLDRFIADYYVKQSAMDARIGSILSNQARIIAHLEGRDLEEVRKEVYDRVALNVKDNAKLTLEDLGFGSEEPGEDT